MCVCVCGGGGGGGGGGGAGEEHVLSCVIPDLDSPVCPAGGKHILAGGKGSSE